MDRHIAIINVGVNSASQRKHKLVSPLFENGSYAYVPIPEEGYDADPRCKYLPTYEELFARCNRVLNLIPISLRGMKAHYDPEFETYTYGDNPHTQEGRGRAGDITKLKKDDLLFFFGRLTKVENQKPTKEAKPCFIGFFEIETVLSPVTARPSEQDLQLFRKNAHVRRGLGDPKYFNGFWVCKGSSESRLFPCPVLFDSELTEKIVQYDKRGHKFVWSSEPTRYSMQHGGRTRPCRLIDGEDQGKRALLEKVLQFNDVPLFKRLLKDCLNRC